MPFLLCYGILFKGYLIVRDVMYSIILKDITKKYGQNTILENISLKAESGRILAITGGNGSGKSTLLKLIMGIEEVSSGEIHYLLNEQEIVDKSFLKNIATVTPELEFYPQLTVQENMELFLGLRDISFNAKIISECLERLGLKANVLNKFFGELSTGMAQRVKLAVLLASNSEIWLLDEPGSNIDEAGVNLLLKEISNAKKAGKLIILATNDSREVAVADEIFQLK